MLKDSHERTIDYARISLTDRCNMRCRYCIPEEEGANSAKQHSQESADNGELLKFEEIYLLIEILKELGVKKFRFTGGEPFARRNAMEFFEGLKGIGEFYITTNLSCGNLDMGRINNLNLGGINVSLDTLDAKKYKWLTRGGDIDAVKRNLKKLRVKKINLNAVMIKNFNENEIKPLMDFALSMGATPRFIEKMNIMKDSLDCAPLDKIKNRLISENILIKEGKPLKNSTAVYHQIKGSDKKAGFIMPVSEPFCETCGKIRLTSKGAMKLCLFAEKSLNLRDMIREGKGKSEIKKILVKTALTKPRSSKIKYQSEFMSAIGG